MKTNCLQLPKTIDPHTPKIIFFRKLISPWIRSWASCLASAFLLCLTGVTNLHAQMYGDFNYTMANGTATITGYNGAGGAIDIPNSINGYPVTSIGYGAFSPNYNGITSLTSVTIPDSVTSIGEYAFCRCAGLTSVTIPNSVTIIEEYAFWGCSGLTSVTIGSGVTGIGVYAFYGCTSLTSITIPNSVTSIGENAFSGCSGLTRVSLPELFLTDIEYIGLSRQGAITVLITGIGNNLGSNNSFITDFTSTVLSKSGNYGLASKADLISLASKSDLTPLATKSDLSTAITPLASKTDVTLLGNNLDTLSGNATFIAALVNNPVFMAALAKQIALGTNNYGISIKQDQSLSFAAIPVLTYVANKTLRLEATSSVKLTPVTFTSGNTAVATVAGNILTIKQAGTTVITASQAGDATYNPATAAQTLTVNKIIQTLSFAAIPAQTYVANKTLTLAVTSSAKLTPIAYSSANTAVATVSGNVVTLKGKGSTTITAAQEGNVNYSPAAAVQVLKVQ
mgnify:CR=1 FL=1